MPPGVLLMEAGHSVSSDKTRKAACAPPARYGTPQSLKPKSIAPSTPRTEQIVEIPEMTDAKHDVMQPTKAIPEQHTGVREHAPSERVGGVA